MASESGTLYTGMTNSIKKRVYEHKSHLIECFTDKYNVDKRLYLESFSEPKSAIRREKQIKSWRRQKKVALIDKENPGWIDLGKDWYY